MKALIIVLSLVFMLVGCTANKDVYLNSAAKAMKAATHDEAVKEYKASAKKITVRQDYYYESLADIHYAYGHYVEAVNDYTRAIRNMGKAGYHLKRGRAYMKLNIYKDALYDFNVVTDTASSKYPVAYVEKAKAYASVGDYKEALKNLKRAKKRGGENVDFLVAMGEVNFEMGKYEEAKTYSQKAIMKDSENSDLYLLRAKIFYKVKDANQAIEDLQKALSLDKNNQDAQRMLAWIYATNPLESYRNGEKALEIAKSLYKANDDAQYAEVVAAAYAELGDFDNAVKTLEEAIRLTSDLVQKEDFRFDIKNYKKGEPLRLW